MITAVKHRFPEAESYVVEQGFEKMARSLASRRLERNETVPKTVMDAISGPTVGARSLEALLKYEVKPLSVNEEEALNAVSFAFRLLKLVVEPGGVASLAAVLEKKADFSGKNVALICSGGNVDPAVYVRALTGA